MNGRGHATLIKGGVSALRSIDLLDAPSSLARRLPTTQLCEKRGACLPDFKSALLCVFKHEASNDGVDRARNRYGQV